MSRLARWLILAPFLLSLLVPVWLLLSEYLGYDIFPAPDPMPPRFDSAWLAATFYIVWYPLLAVFIVPGLFICHPLIHFVPQGFLRFATPGVIAGLVYSLGFLLVYVLFRAIFRRGSRYA